MIERSAPAHSANPLPYEGFFQEIPLDAAWAGDPEQHQYVVRHLVTELRPRVDWQMDPANNLAWRFWLHSFQFLDVPLRLYAERGELKFLRRAIDLVLDWIDANPIGGEDTADHAWYDMGVGVRSAIFAYVWKAATVEHLLTDQEADHILASLKAHAAWLMEPENYRPLSNHGLYEDAGLFLLAERCDAMPEQQELRQFAESRFLATLGRHVDLDEGVHLEHSPGYQFHIRELLDRLTKATSIGGREVAQLVERMGRVAACFVLPDGSMLPFGDTDRWDVPYYARAIERPTGMAFFRAAGYFVVGHGRSFMAATSCYHAHAHKHSDELSWVLFEHDKLLVGDAGRYSYRSEADPKRIYVRSPRAHNVLILDGEEPAWNRIPPYGSGLIAAGAGEGWYAALGTNKLLTSARHRRLFVYRPSEVVIVLDEVSTDAGETVERRVNCGTAIRTHVRDSVVELVAEDDVLAELRDWSGVDVAFDVIRGREGPLVDGWTYPRDNEDVPVDVVVLTSDLPSGLLLHSIAMRPRRVDAVSGSADADDTFRVSCEIDGVQHCLELRVDLDRITVRRMNAADSR